MQSTNYILVIDDEKAFSFLYRDVLQEEGFAVETALTGREAFGVIERRGVPALILLDCQMPSMSGEEFIDEFARRGYSASPCKFVGLSSFSRHGALVQDFRAKVASYHEKPETVEQLLAAVLPHVTK